MRAAAPLLGDLTWLLTVEAAEDGGAPLLSLAGADDRTSTIRSAGP